MQSDAIFIMTLKDNLLKNSTTVQDINLESFIHKDIPDNLSQTPRIHKMLWRVRTALSQHYLSFWSSHPQPEPLNLSPVSSSYHVWTRLKANDSATGGKELLSCCSTCKIAAPLAFKSASFNHHQLCFTADVLRFGDCMCVSTRHPFGT